VALFEGKPRKKESKITQREMDIAASIQSVVEEIVLKTARTLKDTTQSKNLCLAGGVALNCVANGKLKSSGLFDNIWIQPASGDAGGSLGAALSAYYNYFKKPRTYCSKDKMNGGYLGNAYDDHEIINACERYHLTFERIEPDNVHAVAARLVYEGNILGWYQGRSEFGPRALGARSIIADSRPVDMQKKLNLKIKYRESFRPFAPIVMKDKAKKYFSSEHCDNPYMLMVGQVNHENRLPEPDTSLTGLGLLDVPRSTITAVTHVDYSARIQSVDPDTQDSLYRLLSEFEALSGCPVLINTSFN
ncbi:MAG: hypothetical protein CUN55_16195, partial [Phototrophicales bacterium]